MEARRSALLPRVSLDDARAWFLGLGLHAADGVKSRTAAKLAIRVGAGGSSHESREDMLTLSLHAHCVADSPAGLRAHLGMLADSIGRLALCLLINRVLYVPLPTGTMMEVTAMTCAAMWERTPDKIRLLFEYGGRVDQCDSLGLYLEERLSLLPYVNHISLYRNHKCICIDSFNA